MGDGLPQTLPTHRLGPKPGSHRRVGHEPGSARRHGANRSSSFARSHVGLSTFAERFGRGAIADFTRRSLGRFGRFLTTGHQRRRVGLAERQDELLGSVKRTLGSVGRGPQGGGRSRIDFDLTGAHLHAELLVVERERELGVAVAYAGYRSRDQHLGTGSGAHAIADHNLARGE